MTPITLYMANPNLCAHHVVIVHVIALQLVYYMCNDIICSVYNSCIICVVCFRLAAVAAGLACGRRWITVILLTILKSLNTLLLLYMHYHCAGNALEITRYFARAILCVRKFFALDQIFHSTDRKYF